MPVNVILQQVAEIAGDFAILTNSGTIWWPLGHSSSRILARLPADQNCTPGETTAHGFHQYQLVFAKHLMLEGMIECERN